MAEPRHCLGAQVRQLSGIVDVVWLARRRIGPLVRTLTLLGRLGVKGIQADGRDWRRCLRVHDGWGSRARVGSASEDGRCHIGEEDTASITSGAHLGWGECVQLANGLDLAELVDEMAILKFLGMLLETFKAYKKCQPRNGIDEAYPLGRIGLSSSVHTASEALTSQDGRTAMLHGSQRGPKLRTEAVPKILGDVPLGKMGGIVAEGIAVPGAGSARGLNVGRQGTGASRATA